MKISYKKVAWLMPVSAETTLKRIFGKSRYKNILRGIETLKSDNQYARGVLPLTMELLTEFTPLYVQEVSKKFNPKVYDIVNTYETKLKNQETLYF